MNVWQPDQHKDKHDEFVFVEISMQRSRPSAPAGCLAPLPRPPLSISQSARRNPLQCKPLLNTGGSLLFSPPYLFILALPLPSSHGSNKKRLNSRGGQKKMNKDKHSGPNGGFSGGECGWQRWNVGLSGLKGGRFPAEDSTSSGHKGSGWGLLGRAANTCSLFRGHKREVKLQPPPPVGRGCPGFAGTQGGSEGGLLAQGCE